MSCSSLNLSVFLCLFTFGSQFVSAAPLSQPVAPIRPVTDTYFGTSVVDPYRWMENLSAPEVQSWMKAQSAYTHDYLSKLPGRDALAKRMSLLWNSAGRTSLARAYGSRYFYRKESPGDDTWKLYFREGLRGKERLLVDPQVLGGKGKRYTVGEYTPSPDGKFVALVLAAGGAEVGAVRVINVDIGKALPESIDRVWFPYFSWDPSDKYFIYVRNKKMAPNEPLVDAYLDAPAKLHHLGDDPEKDVDVFSRARDPEMGMRPPDTAHVMIEAGCPFAIGIVGDEVQREMTLAISPLDALERGAPVWKKFADASQDITGIAIKGHDIWLLTYKDAPHFKVLHLDLDHPEMTKADTAVAPGDLVLQDIGAARDALYIQATQNGLGRILRVPYDKSPPETLALPYDGSVLGYFTNVQKDGCDWAMSGWTQPYQQYLYDPAGGQVINTHFEPADPADFSSITSQEVMAPSADGTLVPLSIIYRKDLKKDGKNPCLLEGYGAYGISISPYRDPTSLASLEKGIVIAYAHTRGGGENGEDWHRAGQKLTKQNTISDFIGCAEYLIKHGYTSPGKLAGKGTSAGGVLIGGALTQRPDLFTLVIINVGIVNALRFETDPNGIGNIPEFGTVKDADGFKGLQAMDAYSHVKNGTPYPTVLLITGANDPRVAPWEILKMTARLQAATSSKNPVLLRVDYDAGHGMGSSEKQHDLLAADQAALLLSRCR